MLRVFVLVRALPILHYQPTGLPHHLVLERGRPRLLFHLTMSILSHLRFTSALGLLCFHRFQGIVVEEL
jgi:hypothetical protein